MSKLRQYLSTTEERCVPVDFDRVLSEWDIPLDQNITAYEANIWLQAHLDFNDEMVMTCVVEALSDEDWDNAVEFVWLCLKRGIVPHEYVNLLIKLQQTFNEFHS